MDPKILLPVIAGTALAYVVAPAVAIAASQSRHPRCVRCPENGEDVLVRIGMMRAVWSFFSGKPPRVIDCTRWPAFETCLRQCEKDLR
jgi:hypothetical protein